VEIEEDGVVEGKAEQYADELKLTRVIEGIRVEPEETGWGGRKGGRKRNDFGKVGRNAGGARGKEGGKMGGTYHRLHRLVDLGLGARGGTFHRQDRGVAGGGLGKILRGRKGGREGGREGICDPGKACVREEGPGGGMEGGRGTVLFYPPTHSHPHKDMHIYTFICIHIPIPTHPHKDTHTYTFTSIHVYTLPASLTFLHPSLVHAVLPAKLDLELLLVLESLVQSQGMQRGAHDVIPLHLEHEVRANDPAGHRVIHLLFDLSVRARERRGRKRGKEEKFLVMSFL